MAAPRRGRFVDRAGRPSEENDRDAVMKISKSRAILTAATIAGVLLALALINRFLASKRPNVVLITIETTRADHLGCYGYERMTTPSIDKVAGAGALFSNMFVPRGQTWPSLTSMMTSLYPVNHGVRKNGHVLSPSVTGLAEILKQNKYTCAAFLSPSARKAVWRGFDHITPKDQKDAALTRAAINWLNDNRHRNFFLWIHYYQPHDPYNPPEPYNSVFDPEYEGTIDGSVKTIDRISAEKTVLNSADLNHIVSLYDGCIHYVDDQLAKILDAVKTSGVEKDTLLIITADHGENLYRPQSYFGHDASIHDDVLKVPYIMKFPGKIREKARIDRIVESVDVAPTILDFLGIRVPGYFEGRSLRPLLRSGKNAGGFDFAYAEWKNKVLSIRTDKWRYVYNPTGYCPLANNVSPFIIEKEELHAVTDDYQDMDNLMSLRPDVARDLKKILFAWKNFKRWNSVYDTSADEKIPKDIKEHLKSLGYL